MGEVDEGTFERLLAERERQDSAVPTEESVYREWRDDRYTKMNGGKYEDFEGNRVDDSLIREQYFENLRDWGRSR